MGSMVWKVLGGLAAVFASSVAQRGATTVWRAATGDTPPDNPEDPDIHWGEAVGWALFSGAAIGAARLLATRKAAQYYRDSSGSLPKALAKAEKAAEA